MINFLKEHASLTKWILIISLIIALTILVIILLKKKNDRNVKKLTTIAIFSALSFILYYVKIPYPVFTFLDIQFSNIPAFIVGFLLGPVSGVMVIIIRTIIKIPFSSTFCVGEIADLIIGIAIVLASSFAYKRNKTKKGAFIALVIASVCWIVTSLLLNYLFLLPAYMQLFFGANPNNFLVAFDLSSVFSKINESNYMLYYILFGVLPFNVVLSIACSGVTFLVYKRISKIYHEEKSN